MGARIDKYLWSIRLFKTRTIATDACRSGKVTIAGKTIKASREIQKGDLIQIRKDHINIQIEVLDPIEKRVGAKLVEIYRKDLTPPEEYQKLELMRQEFEYRDRGLGRPTKKDRRTISKIKRSFDDE